jgi:hypothetical protein
MLVTTTTTWRIVRSAVVGNEGDLWEEHEQETGVAEL